MARNRDHARFRTRSARLKLPVRKKPYACLAVAPGVQLLYRRNLSNGTWIVRALAKPGSTSYWTKRVAAADDFADADREQVLTFYTAQERARVMARGDDTAAVTEETAAPVTVDAALTAYKADLKARQAKLHNATTPRRHLTVTLLAKPVALLTETELTQWRDGLLEHDAEKKKKPLKPASINRLCNSICAALTLAADRDKRITNRAAWEKGLAGIPDAQRARNDTLTDAKIAAFLAACYKRDHGLGTFMEVLAVTGARASQAVRLEVGDLISDQDAPPGKRAPRLMLPKSGKGGTRDRVTRKSERIALPVSPALADKLAAGAKGRPPGAPLLLRTDGRPWPADPSQAFRDGTRAAFKAIGEPQLTPYVLRHSNVTRLILSGIPIRLIAAMHDTSVKMIESNYSANIAEQSEMARVALFSL